jgi:NTE family protein
MAGARALVLGGGGLAGIAWMTGVVTALAEAGIDVVLADRIVGTSAGATVAAQLATGLSLSELFQRQADPARQSHELVPDPPTVAAVWAQLQAIGAEAADGADPHELRRRIGELALRADTVSETARRAVVDGRLPMHAWPQTWPADKLIITAVDTRTGEPRLFDRNSGVSLVDAVAASCAVPGVWPPVTIGDVRYMDGSVRSPANADLAAGYERILILAPIVDDPALPEQVAALRTDAEVVLITPDDNSLELFGVNPLDPAVRGPAARAGFDQGVLSTVEVARSWA